MRIAKAAAPPAFEEIHPPELRPAMQSVWREGYRQGWRDRGSATAAKGAKARKANLTPERRKEIARNAVAARWAKPRQP